MTSVRLLPTTADLPPLLDGDGRAFEGRFAAGVGGSAARVREVVGQSLAFLARVPREEPWGRFLAVDEAAAAVVGACGFKSGPTPDGAVEIAYGTFPPFEGRGYASATAAALVGRAAADGRVRTVVAHTLPEPDASGRILEKSGFRLPGEVADPEDGRVRRRERPAGGGV